jgi:hypothetical protein
MVYDCPGETVICVSGETEERRVQIIWKNCFNWGNPCNCHGHSQLQLCLLSSALAMIGSDDPYMTLPIATVDLIAAVLNQMGKGHFPCAWQLVYICDQLYKLCSSHSWGSSLRYLPPVHCHCAAP